MLRASGISQAISASASKTMLHAMRRRVSLFGALAAAGQGTFILQTGAVLVKDVAGVVAVR